MAVDMTFSLEVLKGYFITNYNRKFETIDRRVAPYSIFGTTISQDLKWDIHIDSIVKKAQQRLYFLRQLRKFNLP